jgi:WD40 repeat protein
VIATLSAFKGKVSGVQFSPDSQRIATANLDQTANLWDASDGRLLTTLPGFGGEVRSATFSADGRRLVSASSDGVIRIWDVTRQTQPWAELARDACVQLLGAKGRRFSELEIRTDKLLSAEWPEATRDVCAGVPGVPNLAELYQAGGAVSSAPD